MRFPFKSRRVLRVGTYMLELGVEADPSRKAPVRIPRRHIIGFSLSTDTELGTLTLHRVNATPVVLEASPAQMKAWCLALAAAGLCESGPASKPF